MTAPLIIMTFIALSGWIAFLSECRISARRLEMVMHAQRRWMVAETLIHDLLRATNVSTQTRLDQSWDAHAETRERES